MKRSVPSAESFLKYFEEKVASVPAPTESTPTPDSVPGPPGVSFCTFDPIVRCEVVMEAIRQLYRVEAVPLTQCQHQF